MKKILFAAMALIGMAASAQDTDFTTTSSTGGPVSKGFYATFGVAIPGDYKINENLEAAGMPKISDGMFQAGFGYNVTGQKFLMDVEFTADYQNKSTGTHRLRGAVAGIGIRPQWIPLRSENFYVAVGGDITYVNNNFDLFTRNNTIDLNDLNPSTHTGHISLNNEQLYVGPSIGIGAFQNSSFPIRLNAGYQWAVVSSEWKSEVANVNNTFRESGQGRFYAKLTIFL